jgi:hypothetical protein
LKNDVWMAYDVAQSIISSIHVPVLIPQFTRSEISKDRKAVTMKY